jgi:hypothetical protein
MNKIKSIREEVIDKVTILDNQLRRLQWYLNEIRDEELKSLDINLDEYETESYNTDYSNIITLVEEALYERPQEDCRYKEQTNENGR